MDATNLPLQDTPVAPMLTQRLGVPVYVGNDANCALLGEMLWGEGRRLPYSDAHMLMVTVGNRYRQGDRDRRKDLPRPFGKCFRSRPHDYLLHRGTLPLRAHRLLGILCLGNRPDQTDDPGGRKSPGQPAGPDGAGIRSGWPDGLHGGQKRGATLPSRSSNSMRPIWHMGSTI